MQCARKFCSKLTRTKPVTDEAPDQPADLGRCLSTLDLTLMGIGGMVGSGIYILVGIAARELAGPGIVLSFLFAGLTIFLGALCLTEFAARVPRTGSTYLYTYVTLGELLAFLIGWSMVISAILGGAANARAWSAYLDSLFDGAIVNATETYIGTFSVGPPLAARPDLVALCVMLLATLVVALGAHCSSRVTALFMLLNVSVLLFVIVVGFVYADLENWTRDGFLPFGFSGVLSGSTACYWAFTGYEVITISSDETRDPQRSIVRAVGLSLTIVTLLYVSTACALTLVTSYTDIDTEAPLPSAFAARGLTWTRYFLSAGPLCGITTTMLTSQYGMVRIVHAMSSDGLFYSVFGRVHKRTGVPLVAVLGGGSLMAVAGFCLNLRDVISFGVVLNLAQYILVSAGVIILRYRSLSDTGGGGSDIRKHPLAVSLDDLSPLSSTDQAGQDDFRYSQISDLEDDAKMEVKLGHGGHRTGNLPPSGASGSPSGNTGGLRPGLACLAPLCPCAIQSWITLMVLGVLVLVSAAVVLGVHYRHRVLAGDVALVAGLSVLVIGVCLLLLCMAAHKQNEAELFFKVPCVPLVPVLSMVASVTLLASSFTVTAWVGTGIVLLLGLFMYLTYGIRHSALNTRVANTDLGLSTEALLASDTDTDGEESDEI